MDPHLVWNLVRLIPVTLMPTDTLVPYRHLPRPVEDMLRQPNPAATTTIHLPLFPDETVDHHTTWSDFEAGASPEPVNMMMSGIHGNSMFLVVHVRIHVHVVALPVGDDVYVPVVRNIILMPVMIAVLMYGVPQFSALIALAGIDVHVHQM